MAEAGKNGVISWNRLGYKFKGEGPFQRVTTIKAKKGSGDALTNWAARMVAEAAVKIADDLHAGRIDLTSAIIALKSDQLAQAHNQNRDAAADFGTVFHDLVEGIALGDGDALHIADANIEKSVVLAAYKRANPKAKDDDDRTVRLWRQNLATDAQDDITREVAAAKDRLYPDVQAFLDWCDTKKPRWIRNEFQVFNRRFNYAGSVDALVEIDGYLLILDVKTSKSVHRDYSLQLAAYRYAEFLAEPDGTEAPVPGVDGGVILHVRNGACELLEIPCGPAEFSAFTACRGLYDFDRNTPEPTPWARLPMPSLPAGIDDALEAVFR
jgi:hypothetical protein